MSDLWKVTQVWPNEKGPKSILARGIVETGLAKLKFTLFAGAEKGPFVALPSSSWLDANGEKKYDNESEVPRDGAAYNALKTAVLSAYATKTGNSSVSQYVSQDTTAPNQAATDDDIPF